MDIKEPILEAKHISKRFGTVQALRDISFKLYKSEVLGLVGDNGAGKSTLIKIITGVYPADEGEIYLEGRKVCFPTPLEARKAGIETVYQDLALVECMSIYRNFFLGKEIARRIGFFKFLDIKKMKEICMDELSRLGIRIRDVDENVYFLSGGERQSISIGRATFFGAKILILDEPTMALSVRETGKVLELIRKAKQSGLSVIFITHNIYHVYSVADRFIILNRGVKIGEFKKEDVTPEDISEIIASGEVPEKLKNKTIV
ncbi:MAG: ATP-binding cassette domain-containing protein [Candidatus Aenigmatarchaeota archaeon]